MRAVMINRYGGPEQLKIVEVEKPSPKSDEVCVKIIATSVNSADYDLLSGSFFGRMSGPTKPKYRILGSDIAGIVESVGCDVSHLKIGDRVYGDMSEEQFGTFCEYKCVSEKKLYIMPEAMNFTDAAALPSAGVIALQGLNNKKPLESGQSLLINGAGGGMGSYALQVAVYTGALVTAVDSTYKQNKLSELGAIKSLDYKVLDYTKEPQQYDRILDCQSHHKARTYPKVLKEDGIYYMVGGRVGSLLNVAILGNYVSKRNNRFIGILMGRFNNQKEMTMIAEYYQAGIKPIIDKIYNIEDIEAAFYHYKSGEFCGKIVIKIADEV